MSYGLLFTSKDSKKTINVNGNSEFLVSAGVLVSSKFEGDRELFRTFGQELPNGRPLLKLYDEYVFILQPNSKFNGAASIYNFVYYECTKPFLVAPYVYNKYSDESNSNYGIIAMDNTNNFTLSDKIKPLKIIESFVASSNEIKLILLLMTKQNLTTYAMYDKYVGPDKAIIMESWKKWSWFGSMQNGTDKGYREYIISSEIEYTSDYKIKVNYMLKIKNIPDGRVDFRIGNGSTPITKYLHLKDSEQMLIPSHEFLSLVEKLRPSPNHTHNRGGLAYNEFYGNIADEIAISIVDLN